MCDKSPETQAVGLNGDFDHQHRASLGHMAINFLANISDLPPAESLERACLWDSSCCLEPHVGIALEGRPEAGCALSKAMEAVPLGGPFRLLVFVVLLLLSLSVQRAGPWGSRS